MLKLEIGPGEHKIPGFYTLNIVKTPITDFVANVQKELPFDDETFDIVYTSHMLEHIVWYKQDEILRNIFRIIKRGGHLDVWVPDALKIARAFVDAELNGSDDFTQDGWYRFNESRDPCIWFNGRIFSYGDGRGDKGHFNVHATAWSPRMLKQKLLDAGFTRVEVLPNSEVLGYDHGWINMGIRAFKE